MSDFFLPVRVYIEDTDAAGIVYYANYLKFMERARSAWFLTNSIGLNKLMQQYSLVFIVSDLEIQYLESAKIDDMLNVSVTLEKLGKISATFSQKVILNNQTICHGKTRVCCVCTNTKRPKAIPKEVLAHLKNLMPKPNA